MFYARIHGNLLDTLFWAMASIRPPSPPTRGTGPHSPIRSPTREPSQRGPSRSLSPIPRASALPTRSRPRSPSNISSHAISLSPASYIWSRGINIFTQRDLNLGPAQGPYTYTIQDNNNNNVGTYVTPVFDFNLRPDKRYGRVLQVENGGQSWYNALAVQVVKRFSHGLTGQINYTWSHAIDDANMQGASNNISSTFNNATFNGNYPLDKGSSTLDQRHRASINWMWRPTFTTSTSTVARYFVNGWELSGITTLASAHPISPTINGASTSANGVFPGVTLAYSTINGSGGFNRVPFLPLGIIDIDRTYNVDARITRGLPFGERVKANLSFEAFNAFNTIHNTSAQTAAYSVLAGGILRPVLTNGVSHVGRRQRFAGLPGRHQRAAYAGGRAVHVLNLVRSSQVRGSQLRAGVKAPALFVWAIKSGSIEKAHGKRPQRSGHYVEASTPPRQRKTPAARRTAFRRICSVAESVPPPSSGRPASLAKATAQCLFQSTGGSAVLRTGC